MPPWGWPRCAGSTRTPAMTRPTPKKPLKIGTRGSPLALAQAHETRERLARAWDLPDAAFEIAIITTTGDRVQDRPLKEIGGKGLFTKEIEDGLLSGQIDIAVHSMKDMPVAQPHGLVLDTFLPREDVRDALVGPPAALEDLGQGATVGTSSIRRKAQLLARRPDLNVVEFRGNVQTRLKKLKDGVAEATFLAQAGINRLNLADVIPATPIETAALLPAVAQGAIGIERRADDSGVADLLAAIHDIPTATRLAAERSFLATLDGSCQAPIAGLATLAGATLTLSGEILRLDGSEVIAGELSGPEEDAAFMGEGLAQRLKAQAGEGFW